MEYRYLKTGKARVIGKSREVVGLTKDGRRLVIELLLNSVIDEKGGVAFVGVLNDITSE